MKEVTEIEKLASLLFSESPETLITFREESARNVRYMLKVGVNDERLFHKLARIFGHSGEQFLWQKGLPFEASDDWHGRGEVDLRELADELIPMKGEFFDFDITISGFRLLAHEIASKA